MAKSNHSTEIFQIKVTLKGVRPPIWRRFLVPATITLDEFHTVLLVVMGWDGGHLHAFVTPHDDIYSAIDPTSFADDYSINEKGVKLAKLLIREGSKIRYDYDFGDNWEHDIVLEKVLPFDPSQPLPYCLTGKRACPPEDCGGVWGYQELLQVIADPSHEDHEEMLEWVPDGFEPEVFDIDEVNQVFLKSKVL
jgi:hypothetical protein